MSKPRPPESERRLRHNVRLARLLRFLELVGGRGQWNPKTLMAELEVSERTVHRLRETLELAGVPIAYDKTENAYRVHGSYRFPTLNLSEEEAIGQASATALGESDELKLPQSSGATTRKLIDTGNERLRHILTDATKLMTVLGLKLADHPEQRARITAVQKALVERKRIVGTKVPMSRGRSRSTCTPGGLPW
jgi:predicted DNA-binding transcriptional regulator YafY